jgi:hypothetical protein
LVGVGRGVIRGLMKRRWKCVLKVVKVGEGQRGESGYG